MVQFAPIQTYKGPGLDILGSFQKGQQIRATSEEQTRKQEVKDILSRFSDPRERQEALMAIGATGEAAKVQSMESARAGEQREATVFGQEQQDRAAAQTAAAVERQEQAIGRGVRMLKGLPSAVEGIEDPEQRERVWDTYVQGAVQQLQQDPEAMAWVGQMIGGNGAALDNYSEEGLEIIKQIASYGENVLAMKPEAPTPRTDLGKLTADLNAGLITQEQYNSQAKEAIESGADIKDEISVRKEYNALSKSYFDVQGAHDRVLASVKDPTAAGDLALVFNFMKMLDPGSTVREGEFATAAASAGLGQRIIAAANKVDTGERLSAAQRDDFADRAEKLWGAAKKTHKTTRDRYVELAQTYGMEPDNIVGKPTEEGGVKTIATDADYDALESGEQFIAPDGTTRTKP